MPRGSVDRNGEQSPRASAGRVISLPDHVLARIVADEDPDDRLSPEADELRREGIPATTEATYRHQWRRWVMWCGDTGREHLPATRATVIEWINAHWSMARPDGRLRGRYGQPYAPETVELSLAVVSVVHQYAGHPSPTRHPSVHQTMRGYRHRWKRRGFRTDEAYALTTEDLVAMLFTCDLATLAGLRNALVLRLGFDMGARGSDLRAVSMRDVTFPGAGRMLVHIPYGKTDRDAQGRDVAIEADEVLAPEYCPVTLTRRWLEVLRGRGNSTGPLLRQIRTGRPRKDGALGGTILPTGMTKTDVENVVTNAAASSGIDRDPVTGEERHVVAHSLRAGFATSASAAGADTATIAEHGGWSKESPVVFRYVRHGRRWGEQNAATQIRRAHADRRPSKEEGGGDR